MSNFPSGPNEIAIGTEPTDAVVQVKLTTIEHKADRNDQVDNKFNVSLSVSDGKNPVGNYGPEGITLQPGQSHPVNEWLFTGTYEDKCNKDVGAITFIFNASTDYVVAMPFVGVTTGNNALKSAGTYYFNAPVTLEQGGSKSVLVFRGSIHVSC